MNASGEVEAFYDWYHPTHVVLGLLMSALGLLLNPILAFCLLQKQLRSPVNNFLTAIAICQALLSFTYLAYLIHFDVMPVERTCRLSPFTFTAACFGVVHANASIVLRAAGLWLAAVMGGYRARVIRKPIHVHPVPGRFWRDGGGVEMAAPIVEKPYASHALIGATLGACLLTATPIYLLNGVREMSVVRNASVYAGCPSLLYHVDFTELGQWKAGLLVRFSHWLNGTAFKLMPCLLLAYFSLRMVLYLYTYKHYRQVILRMNEKSTISVSPSTYFLTVILVVTGVLELPNVLASVYAAFASLSDAQENVENPGHLIYKNFGDLFDDLSLFSSLTTFPLYCVMSSDFRRTFAAIFFSRPYFCRQIFRM